MGKNQKGNGNPAITLLCYADDAILMAQNGDDLLRLTYNMEVLAQKFICINFRLDIKSIRTHTRTSSRALFPLYFGEQNVIC